MYWPGVLLVILVSTFEAAVQGSSSSSKKSPIKKESKVASPAKRSPSKLDTNLAFTKTLSDLAFSLASPLKVTDSYTKHLSLNFDGISDDDDFPCDLFLPSTSSIYAENSWNLPLESSNHTKNLMNLERKLKSIASKLKEELFDHATSLSWVSNGSLLAGYISVVSASISQLKYLISRLNASPTFPELSKLKIHSLVRNHLNVLTEFCQDMMSYSGISGFTFKEGRLSDPTRYFEHLIGLRDDSGVGMTDEMFETLIKFFFNAYSVDYYDQLAGIFMKNTRSDYWIPLPIEYLRDHMLLEQPENIVKFFKVWTENVFEGVDFDSRHLINLGRLMQQGFFTLISLRLFTAKTSYQSQYSFDSNMIEFLTLAASSPWLLPTDQETAMLIGNFASPHLKFSEIPETEKAEIIEEIFKYFAGPANFTLIEDAEYGNLCKLIQRLDMAYPGISSKLWAHVNGVATVERTKPYNMHLITEFKTECYASDLKTLSEKASYLREYLDEQSTVESVLVDTKTLYFLVEFYTDVLVEAVEAAGDIEGTDEHLMSIFDSSVKFFDTFLKYRAHKSVINYFYSEYDYIPTRLFKALHDLSSLADYCMLLANVTIKIRTNIVKLVDHHMGYARAFVIMLQSVTAKYKSFSCFSDHIAPKCLVESGEIDSYNYAFMQTLLAVDETKLDDSFFTILSDKIASDELSYKTAGLILQELLDNENLKFDMTETGFSSFWSPLLILKLAKKIDKGMSAEEEGHIKKLFKLYMKLSSAKNERIGLTTGMLKGISCFTGFAQFFKAEIDETSGTFRPEVFDEMFLNPNSSSVNFSDLVLLLSSMFHIIMTENVQIGQAQKILEKLLNIAQVFVSNYNEENFDNNDFIYIFNSLLLVLIRIPAISIPDEGGAAIVLYEFFRNYYILVPKHKYNLVKNLKSSTTLARLYGKMISYGDALPENAFDLLSTQNKKSEIASVQQFYIRTMIKNQKQMMDATRLNPLTIWIRNGIIHEASFLKLVKSLAPDLDYRLFLNFLPLVTEYVRSSNYLVARKVEILEHFFSTANDAIIRTLSNRRTSLFHESFMELFTTEPSEPIDKFLELCKDTDWKEGLVIDIARYKLGIILNGTKTSANLSIRASVYLKELISIINDPVPNYEVRKGVSDEANVIAPRLIDILPILRDNPITNVPLQQCVNYIISSNLQLHDGPASFFSLNATTEAFLALFRLQDAIYTKNPRNSQILNALLNAFVTPDSRRSMIAMIPNMITIDSFVVNSDSFKFIQSWFSSVDDSFSTLAEFLGVMVSFASGKILENCIKCETAPVLDKMFAVFTNLFTDNLLVVSKNSKIHNEVLSMLIDLIAFRRDFIENSKKLMGYLKHVVESFVHEQSLMMKVISVLKEFPGFYLTNKIEWITIWKKLNQSISVEFIGDASLNVLLTLGSTNISDWQPLINSIYGMKLPQRIVTSLLVNLYTNSKMFDLELLQILPDELHLEYFESFDEIEDLSSYMFQSLKTMEKNKCYSLKTFEKFLVLLNFDAKIGENKNWTWRRIFHLVDPSQPEFVNRLVMNLNAMKSTVLKGAFKNANEVTKFIFELKQLKSELRESEMLMAKIVGIYDEISDTVSIQPTEDEKQIYSDITEYIKLSRTKRIADTCENDILVGIESLITFDLEFDKVDGRNDSHAGSGISSAIAIANYVYKAGTSGIRKELLQQVCDLVVKTVHGHLKQGDNLVAFAQSLDEMGLESFILFVGAHVQEQTEEFNFIVGELMKFADFTVGDYFFQQISTSDIRVDVCQFTEEIIRTFGWVTYEGFQKINEETWPILYLNNLINSEESIPIHSGHFKQFLNLIKEIDCVFIEYSEIFKRLGTLMSRTASIPDILNVVDSLLKDMDLNIADFYQNFLSESVLKSVLSAATSENRTKFVKFLKKFQENNREAFTKWCTEGIKTETNKLVTRALEADTETGKINLHSTIATRMIQKIEETVLDHPEKLEQLLASFKNLNAKIIDPVLVYGLGASLVDALMKCDICDSKWTSPVQNCVKFLLNLPAIESKTYAKLNEITKVVFSGELLLLLVEMANSEEALRTILNDFASNIDVSHLKLIKNSLCKFNVQEDRGILLLAAKNSDAIQLMEYYRNANSLSVEEKLALLNVCERTNLNVEKVGVLINYYQNLLNNRTVGDKNIILKGLLNNATVMASFTSVNRSTSKNKATVLALLKSNLSFEAAHSMLLNVDDLVGKLILNIYFAPSSSLTPIIPSDTTDTERIMNFFNNLISEIVAIVDESLGVEVVKSCKKRVQEYLNKINNKIPIFLKAFKLYEEIDRRDGVVSSSNILELMTVALYDNLQQDRQFIFVSSPSTIYAVTKLARRVASIKIDRLFILNKMLNTMPETARVDCFKAFTAAQLDSGNIDWELHEAMQRKTLKSPRIQELLKAFEAEHK